jgi:hypothetical protein
MICDFFNTLTSSWVHFTIATSKSLDKTGFDTKSLAPERKS